MPSGSSRRLAAAGVPVAAIAFAWATLESGARPAVFIGLAAAALLASLPSRPLVRLAAAGSVTLGVAVVLVRIASENVADIVDRGLMDAYAVAPPFVSATHAELHALVALLAATLAVGVAATAGERPFVAATIAAAGVGIPVTVNPSRNTVAMGAVALVAVLWPVAIAGMADRAGFPPGATVVAGVTLAAVVLAAVGARPSVAALDWRHWDLFGETDAGRTVTLVWSSDYTGIDFPAEKTTVLRVAAPRRGLYWRATTLDTFAGDRWLESLHASDSGLGFAGRRLPPDRLLPRAAALPRNWVKQTVDVRALLDDHIVAAAQPVAIDPGTHPRPRVRSGGVIVKQAGASALRRYTVWSYAPNPTPEELLRAPPTYPAELARYLTVGRPTVPPFGIRGRAAEVEALFTDLRYQPLLPYRETWREARRLTAGARTPFEATIAIERWLRSRGGFVYDQHPPPPRGLPALADFQQRSKRGYCQQFAGTMALMLRYLGIPARVAVGFTRGKWEDGGWTVTDHDAHAWVEVWFAGHGWLPFDPTPGRGTLSATYTNASDSADAVRALGTGRFLGEDAAGRNPKRRGVPVAPEQLAKDTFNWWAVTPPLGLIVSLFVLAGAKSVRRIRRSSVRDPRGRATAARAEIAAFICDQGAPVTVSTPVFELATELTGFGVGSAAFEAAFSRARYGPLDGAAAAADEARVEVRSVIAALRRRLGPARRVRGFLALKSLRSQ